MGAVIKDNIVAILIKVPISDSKNTKIIIVTMDIIKIQVLYPLIFLWFNNFSVWLIVRGDASKHVIVVLNIVVNAATDIKILTFSPRLAVYNLISWLANSDPLFENVSPDPNITKAPRATKHNPRNTVEMYPTLKSNNADLYLI